MSSTLNQAEPSTMVACAHCGLPTTIARGEFDSAAAGPVFCCSGCHGAFELIHGWGLETFYELRDLAPADAPVGESTQIFTDLDDPALLGQSAPLQVGPEGGKALVNGTVQAINALWK